MHSCVRLFVIPWTIDQAPLSMESSRQESWSGLPFPTPGDLPHPGMEPASLASPALAGGFFTPEPPGRSEWESARLTEGGRKGKGHFRPHTHSLSPATLTGGLLCASMVGGWDAAANKAELLPCVAGIRERGRQAVNTGTFRRDEGSKRLAQA